MKNIAAFQAATKDMSHSQGVAPLALTKLLEALKNSIIRQGASLNLKDKENRPPLLYVDIATPLVSAYGALPWADILRPFRPFNSMAHIYGISAGGGAWEQDRH